jgi:DivIVA domain-containing protein
VDPHDEAGPAREQRAPTFELNPADWTTADEIRRRSFSTANQGFDPQEVRDYLAKLADWFADLNVQLSRLRKSQQTYAAEAAAPVPAPPAVDGAPVQPEVGGLAARMADVLREAEEHASRVRADAELRAEQMLAQSREDAERLRTESGGRPRTNLKRSRRSGGRPTRPGGRRRPRSSSPMRSPWTRAASPSFSSPRRLRSPRPRLPEGRRPGRRSPRDGDGQDATPSNVRRLPGIEVRPTPDIGGDQPSPA